MSSARFDIGLYSTRYTTDQSVLWQPYSPQPPARRYGVIGCHGHGGGATGWVFNQLFLDTAGPFAQALAEAGFTVLAVDHARINSWGDPDALRALDDAYNYLVNVLGCQPKVGIIGPSMGGMVALNWIKANASKVAAMWGWASMSDMDWAHSTSGYTPAYNPTATAPSPAGDATYTSEIDSTFGPVLTVASVLEFEWQESLLGIADGDPVTSANSDYDTISGSGAAVVSTTDVALPGANSVRVTATGGTKLLTHTLAAGKTSETFPFLVRFNSLPSGAVAIPFAQILNNGSIIAQLRIDTASKIGVRNGVSQVATSATTPTVGKWYRCEWQVNYTGSTQTLRWYDGPESMTLVEAALTGAFSTGTVFNQICHGIIQSGTWDVSFQLPGAVAGTTWPGAPWPVITVNDTLGNMPADPTRWTTGYNSFWTASNRTGKEIRYRKRDDTHLLGAYDASGAASLSLAAASSLYGFYQDQSNGYRGRDEYASWRGIGVRIHIFHGDADSTLPIEQTEAFIAGVNDPLVTMTTVPGKTHITVIEGASPADMVSYFRANVGEPIPTIGQLAGYAIEDVAATAIEDLGTLLPLGLT